MVFAYFASHYRFMRFDQYNIAPEIKQSLVELGFKRPTDIQYKAIPSILKGEDVLAIAQTGTGKTAAFAIPIIHQINLRKTSKRSDGIKCLVMVPTHELAQQVTEVFSKLGKYTKVKSFCIFVKPMCRRCVTSMVVPWDYIGNTLRETSQNF